MARAWVFGSDVNTDVIIPARYNITIDEQELAKHAFCEVRPELPNKLKKGDIIVGGSNFGCGSSREHAPIAIKGLGVGAVIAQSYARIFFRNAINIGLPIFECDDLDIAEGDDIAVDINTGKITNHTNGKTMQAKPLPEFVKKIVASGGIVNFLRNHDVSELQ